MHGVSGLCNRPVRDSYAPMTAIEFGRKVLFSTERPAFNELEAHVKKK